MKIKVKVGKTWRQCRGGTKR